MKFASSIIALSAFVASASAKVCFTKSGAGFNTASNIKLSAVNTTLPNANSTGVPLTQGLALGSASREQAWWFNTISSAPYDGAQPFNLTDGTIVVAKPAVFFSREVASGGVLGLANEDQLAGATPGDDYCTVSSHIPERPGKLAVNGRADLFSICQYSTGLFKQFVVVYNGTAVPGSTASDGIPCYSVELLVNQA